MKSRAYVIAAALAFSPAILAMPGHAEQAAVHTGTFSNLAVGGYDAVSYFSGVPAKGQRAFSTEYMGAVWQFSNEANLAKFKADPEAYAPQYGGYCAWAVSQGYTAKGDPRFWAVHDGKLYLNFNKQVQTDWDKDRRGFITKANANWPDVLKD